MSIFNFFKKFRKEHSLDVERIEFRDIEPNLKKRKEILKEEKIRFNKELNERLGSLIESLKERIKIMSSVNVDEKPADQRIKFIVKENLKKYTNQVERFLNNLESFYQEKFSEPVKNIERINTLFLNFEKLSFPFYQKATFLVGKEIGNVREEIMGFITSFKKFLKEERNSKLLSDLENISLIEAKLNEISEDKRTKGSLQEDLKNIDKIISSFKEDIKKTEGEINEKKNSREYLEELEKNEGLEKEKEQVKKEIYELKSEIDFKFLTNIFHSVEREMKVLKDHQSSFYESFTKDSGNSLKELIEDTNLNRSGMNKNMIIKKLEKISCRLEWIKESEKNISFRKSTEIAMKESEINNIKMRLNEMNEQKSREIKKIEKIEESENNKQDSLNPLLNKIGFEISS
jgi:hypothetical protein